MLSSDVTDLVIAGTTIAFIVCCYLAVMLMTPDEPVAVAPVRRPAPIEYVPVMRPQPARSSAPASVITDAQIAILLDAHYKHVLSSAQGRAMWRSLLDNTEPPVAA
jgi:hypothetical protein